MFLKFFYSFDTFQINSYVPMIHYEPYYSKKSYTLHQFELSIINMKN
jgi:hypothetical protein